MTWLSARHASCTFQVKRHQSSQEDQEASIISRASIVILRKPVKGTPGSGVAFASELAFHGKLAGHRSRQLKLDAVGVFERQDLDAERGQRGDLAVRDAALVEQPDRFL